MFRDYNVSLAKADPNDKYIALDPMKAEGISTAAGTVVNPTGRTGWMATIITNKNKKPRKGYQVPRLSDVEGRAAAGHIRTGRTRLYL